MDVKRTRRRIYLKARDLKAAVKDIPTKVIPLSGNLSKYSAVLRKVKTLFR